MYKFIDVAETQGSVSLPSEALMINGEYIENLITGYRTLTVEGREALSPELSFFETGLRDGATKKGKRYPPRIIRITYQLIAESAAAFREAYNKLGAILAVEDAMLVFNDESDKYYTGSPSYIGEVEPGKCAVVGEFEITCLDPFKYSVMEYEAEAARGESSVLIDYQGTYKSFPILQANLATEDEASEDGESAIALTGNGDCGYVAFFNEREKIIQIGSPEEPDGVVLTPSQTLINQAFDKETSWGTAAKASWLVNSGITTSSAVEQGGGVDMYVSSTTKNPNPTTVKTVLLSAISRSDAPVFNYAITAHASNRTTTQVTVKFVIDVWLDNSESYFGSGYSLRGKIKISGTEHVIMLKDKNDYWRGKTKHTKILTVKIPVVTHISEITGLTFETDRPDGTGGTAGILSREMQNIALPVYFAPAPATYYLRAKTYGSGSDWHGPSITRRIPADDAGKTGAKSFRLEWRNKMSIGEDGDGTSQLGAFQVLLVSGSGESRKIVAGMNVYKGSNGTKAKLRYYINNTVKQTVDVDLSSNKGLLANSPTSYIEKYGSKITFAVGNLKTVYYDANVAETEAEEITFTFTCFDDKPQLKYNGLEWVRFTKNNCDRWGNVKNKFGANDVIEADCHTGDIRLNGIDTPALGALGNDWEGLYLTPGINQIGFAYSEWVNPLYAPTFKVKYREVFL